MRTERFWGENYHYIWSDNWCLDKDMVWFISGSMNMLFCLNRKTKKTDLVSLIPSDDACIFRQHPKCIKKGQMIVCLPDSGNDIWCYHLSAHSWTKIFIENPDEVRLACHNAWFIKEKLYLVSFGLKQVIETDINLTKVENYHQLSARDMGCLSSSVLVDNDIYVVGSHPTCIYKFNCSDKSIKTYELVEIDDQIQTLCFDGKKFWLSGQYKKFYIWNEDTGEIIFLDKFPDTFGIWNFSGKYKKLFTCDETFVESPLFLNSVSVGDYVWFIPFQTNEILYVDKNTFAIKHFYIENEDHTAEDVKKQLLHHKYLLEYIKDDRYMGLFSLKNKQIFEIDCKELKYQFFDYEFNGDTRVDEYVMKEWLKRDSFVREENVSDLTVFLKSLSEENEEMQEERKRIIGDEIYHKLK